MSKGELIPKYGKVNATAVVLDIENKQLKKDLDVAKMESQQYKDEQFSRVEKEKQKEEEKKKTNVRTQIRRKRTQNLKDYVKAYLHGWEVDKSSINHLDSNILMKFQLKSSSDCTIPGSVSFTDEVIVRGTVSPADLDELEKLRKR